MKSTLSNACTLKFQNFEGPFDLLFHLVEKNKMSIYDIKINEIADQYMEYLRQMQELDLDIASEFLVLASTLLHIKSKSLLPSKKETEENESDIDPKEELVLKLIEYKKYKKFTQILKEKEEKFTKMYYKGVEGLNYEFAEAKLEIEPERLKDFYKALLRKNKGKKNDTTQKMSAILKVEKVSLRSKVRVIIKALLSNVTLKFKDLFSFKKSSKLEVITGFLAMLELSKLKKIEIFQEGLFSDIFIKRKDIHLNQEEEELIGNGGEYD